jgi:PKD repeat protein
MNWGWEGYEDGYFSLNSLNPDNIPLSTGEEALIGIEPAPEVADFSGAPLIVRAGDTVLFYDNSLGYDTITARKWSFPGGTTSNATAQNPIVSYANPGTYAVSETVTSKRGSNSLNRTSYVTVLDNNTVNVYPTLSNGTFTIQLNNASLAASNMEFSLYDILGHKVFTTTLVEYITQVTVFLPRGMYFFRAFDTSGKPISTGKLMIQ